MDKIQKSLLKPQTKENKDSVVNYVIDNPKEIDKLMSCFFSEEPLLNQRASWPMSVIGEKRPDILLPYLSRMLKKLDNPVHDAIIRNTLRVMQTMDIPEELEGIVYDKCFNYLIDQNKAPAIRAFAITVLSNIAIKYPDLKEELSKTIELYYPQGSKGFQSRARKELKRLQ